MRIGWLVALVVGCGASADSPSDAAPPLVLRCEVPRSTPLVASEEPPNAGVPVAAIGWSDGECTLRSETGHPDDLVAIADLTGIFSGSLSLVSLGEWNVESSSLSTRPTTMLVGLPRDTDLELLLENDDDVRVRDRLPRRRRRGDRPIDDAGLSAGSLPRSRQSRHVSVAVRRPNHRIDVFGAGRQAERPDVT